MSRKLVIAAVAAAIALPGVASAQSGVRIPVVRIPATVSGTWVLNPHACPDIREDIRDARVTHSRQDRREDRRDQRIIDCPASAYSFVPNPGQAPNRPIRVGRDGSTSYLGDGHGYGRPYSAPVTVQPKPVYQVPSYQTPSYPAPTYRVPSYQTPTYSAPAQPTYSAPSQSRYEIRNGQVIWLD